MGSLSRKSGYNNNNYEDDDDDEKKIQCNNTGKNRREYKASAVKIE